MKYPGERCLCDTPLSGSAHWHRPVGDCSHDVSGWGRGLDAPGYTLPMSAISSDEFARVAALARVALSEEEVTRLAGELDAVASSFARVTSVVTPDLPATSHPVPLNNVLREDAPGPTLDVDELLSGAPAAEDSMFLVPQILGEDSAS